MTALNDLPGFRCATPGGAFYAFPNIEGTGRSSRDLERDLLERAGVATISGTSFGEMGRRLSALLLCRLDRGDPGGVQAHRRDPRSR